MSEGVLIKTCGLGGGIEATVSDCTRHYFGGYYHVRIVVSADVPVAAGRFESDADCRDAVILLGESVTFKRTLEKMAVPEVEIDTVRQQLLTAFDTNVLSYLQRDDFVPGFVRSEYTKKLKSKPHFHR